MHWHYRYHTHIGLGYSRWYTPLACTSIIHEYRQHIRRLTWGHGGVLDWESPEVFPLVARGIYQPIRIVATGNREALAYYEQIPEPGDAPVIANASEITYLIEEEKLILKGSAKITQHDYFFAGEEIQYDISKGVINANSKSRRGQVRMTISPRDDSDP